MEEKRETQTREEESRAVQIWKMKMEVDGWDPLPADYQKRIRDNFEKIRQLCYRHPCTEEENNKSKKKESCAVCAAYMEWATSQYKLSYRIDSYPLDLRQKLEEYFFYSQKTPLCVENPYWEMARRGIKGGHRAKRKARMRREKAAKAKECDKLQEEGQAVPKPTEEQIQTVLQMTIEEQAEIIRNNTKELIQWFNKNGLEGKPPPDLPEKSATPKLAADRKDYSRRIMSAYERVHLLHEVHNCTNPKKRVSEDDSCPVCSAYIDWAAEQYEESYKDWRYPPTVRQELEKALYYYGGKPPLCVMNPHWPKAKDRMRRARRRWELEASEGGGGRGGWLRGGEKIIGSSDMRSFDPTPGVSPRTAITQEMEETPAKTPATVEQNQDKGLKSSTRTAKGGGGRAEKTQKMQTARGSGRRTKTTRNGKKQRGKNSVDTAKTMRTATTPVTTSAVTPLDRTASLAETPEHSVSAETPREVDKKMKSAETAKSN